MTPEQLTGRSTDHIVSLTEPDCRIHAGVEAPLLRMIAAARRDGIDLVPVSAFRSFERQLQIWNGKFSGERPVYDKDGRSVDVGPLSEVERIEVILLWSAVPGASRHHWGTDLDFIDRAAIPTGYQVKLVTEEYGPDGPFAALSAWLAREAGRHGFFRPFKGVLSGVAPEPWHWSYAPLAEPARAQLTPDVLQRVFVEAPILGKAGLLSRLDEVHRRFVAAIDPPGDGVWV